MLNSKEDDSEEESSELPCVANMQGIFMFGTLPDSPHFMGLLQQPKLEISLDSLPILYGNGKASVVPVDGGASCQEAARSTEYWKQAELRYRQCSLQEEGFCSAPQSDELVEAFWTALSDMWSTGKQNFSVHVKEGWIEAGTPLGTLVEKTIEQLSSVLPETATLLDAFAQPYRPNALHFRGKGFETSIHNVHRDSTFVVCGVDTDPLDMNAIKVQRGQSTLDAYVALHLFPNLYFDSSASLEDVFKCYFDLRERLQYLHDDLDLPDFACEFARKYQGPEEMLQHGAGKEMAREFLTAIRKYNAMKDDPNKLVLDLINAWVPLDTKQLALLPISDSQQVIDNFSHPLEIFRTCGSRVSPDSWSAAIGRTGNVDHFSNKFKTFRRGSAVFFFGQHVYHQAAKAPECLRTSVDDPFANPTGVDWDSPYFEDGSGSLEMRFLSLTPRKETHDSSLHISRTPVGLLPDCQNLLYHVDTISGGERRRGQCTMNND